MSISNQIRTRLDALRQSKVQQLPSEPASSQQEGVLRSVWWGYFPVILVAVVSLLLSAAVYVQYSIWERTQVEIAFREASQDRILVVQREIKTALGVVQDIASFFQASEKVGRREFRKFVGPALKRQAGIMALEWVPVVSAEQRDMFVNEARSSFPPFQISEPDSAGQGVESESRALLYPVLYVQPYKENKARLGLDLGTDAHLSQLLADAEVLQKLQVSSSMLLKSPAGDKHGFVVAVPVYDGQQASVDVAETSVPRIRGFALGHFAVSDIVERALESLRSGGIDLHFYQIGSDVKQKLLYTHLSRLRGGVQPGHQAVGSGVEYQQTISAGNQRWLVICNPVVGKFKTETWLSSVILVGGIAISGLLTVYMATLVGRGRRVRLEVDERTSQLRTAIQALNREVGDRRSAQQELQQLNNRLEHHIAYRTAEAERRAQYLEQFAYVTSHDLKAPLRAVSNLAEWIEEDLDEKLDDASREQLALLRDRVRRMHDLIEGLLEYSRVGRTADSGQVVDVRELLDEIVDSLSPPKRFKIKIQPEMPVMHVDRLQLGQVFSNLISNGIKHHGGDRGKIRVSCETSGDHFLFSVCDDGQGIAPEYHDKIFLIFQTLEPSDFESSTGIGLALVKKIVEEHGGTIRLKSTLGEGACFYFSWPRKSESDAS